MRIQAVTQPGEGPATIAGPFATYYGPVLCTARCSRAGGLARHISEADFLDACAVKAKSR